MNEVLPARQERAIKASAASRRRRKYETMAAELEQAGYTVLRPRADTLTYPTEAVLSPPFGEWHTIDGGLQVRVMPFDVMGTLRVRRRPGGDEQ
jgi:hypothetical protein